MTPQRYDLKQWWSKVTNRPYEKFIPWSEIHIWTNRGLDPKLKDQVIFQMGNVNRTMLPEYEQNLWIPDHMGPNVDNEFRLYSKFISSNRCERMAILENKYEKYHNDLNIALYGNEEQFNVENRHPSDSFYYKKATCEIDERINGSKFGARISYQEEFGQSGFHFCQSSDGSYFILGDGDSVLFPKRVC